MESALREHIAAVALTVDAVAGRELPIGTQPLCISGPGGEPFGATVVVGDYLVDGADGSCGSCWAFGSTAAVELAIAYSDKTIVDFSEQYVLSCSGAGTCGGGYWAYDLFVKPGAEAFLAAAASPAPPSSRTSSTTAPSARASTAKRRATSSM